MRGQDFLVVETHHGHIVGNAQPKLFDGIIGAHSHAVGGAKEGGWGAAGIASRSGRVMKPMRR